jgi:hypothetical protein
MSDEVVSSPGIPEQITQAPQTPAETADVKLRRLEQDKGWRDRLSAGDPTTKAEWKTLLSEIDGTGRTDDPRVDAILAGEISRPPTSESLAGRELPTRMILDAVEQMRSLGISDEAIKQGINGGITISKNEHQMVSRLLAQRESDPEWKQRLWAGDPVARREFKLIHIALTSEVAEDRR